MVPTSDPAARTVGTLSDGSSKQVLKPASRFPTVQAITLMTWALHPCRVRRMSRSGVLSPASIPREHQRVTIMMDANDLLNLTDQFNAEMDRLGPFEPRPLLAVAVDRKSVV